MCLPSTCALASAVMKSSRGSRRRALESRWKYSRNSCRARSAVSASVAPCWYSGSAAPRSVLERWKTCCQSSRGMPSISAITASGMMAASASTKSTWARSATRASVSSTIPPTAARLDSSAFGVNCWLRRFRYRPCSGGSMLSRWRNGGASVGACSSGKTPSRGAMTNRRWARSMAPQSSYRVIAQKGSFPGGSIQATGAGRLSLAQGYRVALVARTADFTRTLAAEIRSAGGIALPVEGDATIPTQVSAVYERIGGELGTPEVLIYNGGRRPFGVLVETTPEVFEETWRVHAFGAFLWARQVVPAMLERHQGAILITGATAGVKPGPNSAAFGPAKFAVRGLAQVLSRDLHPQGIHVAYVNVDGAIDMPLIRQFLPQLKDEDLLKPSAIADAFWFLAHQDPSAWSHELDVRPFKEKF